MKKSKRLKQNTISEFAQKADIYDSDGMFEMVKADYEEVINEVLREPFDVLVDYGCGTGEFIKRLYARKQNCKYIGVDITPEILGVAKEKNKTAEFINGDSENTIFDQDSIDVVTCIHSFHHYPEPACFLNNAFVSLKPGGRLIIRDNSSDSILMYLWMNYFRYPLSRMRGKGDVHYYSTAEIKSLGEATGFITESIVVKNKNKLHCVFRKALERQGQ